MEQHDPSAHNSGVWPPPPTVDLTPTVRFPAFVPTQRLSNIYTGLSLATIAGNVFSALAVAVSPNANIFVAGLTSLITLVGFVYFMVWAYRSHKNLSALGRQGLQYTPVWAVGGFFVPFLSLYRPYQVFREIWQGSDSSPASRVDQGWQRTKTPPLLPVWWLCYLIAAIPVLIDRLNGPGAGGLGTVTPAGTLITDSVNILAAVLTLLVVRAITDRQEQAAHSPGTALDREPTQGLR